jgi:predicted ThiF/HesA family dinucleotide-utilizing enzyme
MRPEETIEKKFVTECEKIGIKAFKFEIPGHRGAPDRIVFLPKGRVLFIEFKTPIGKLSQHQIEFIEYLTNKEFSVLVSTEWKTPFNMVRSMCSEK